MILSTLPLLLILNLPFNYSTMMPIAVVGGILAGIPGSNIAAIVLNVNTPDTRGRAGAFLNIAGDVGQGIGPPIIGAVIASMGRQNAFNLISFFWVFSGLLCLLVIRTMAADEADVAEKVAARFGDHQLDSVVTEDSVNAVDARIVAQAATPVVGERERESILY